MFGRGATLDPKLVAKVKALPPGKRLLVDRNGDGKNDEAWFLDTAGRLADIAGRIAVNKEVVNAAEDGEDFPQLARAYSLERASGIG